MRVTGLLFGDGLGCRVTSPLWDLLVRVAVHADDDSEVGACREPEKRSGLVPAPTDRKGEASHNQGPRASN